MKHRVVCRSCRHRLFTHDPVGALAYHRRQHVKADSNMYLRSWPASALDSWEMSKRQRALHDLRVVVADGMAHMCCPCGWAELLPERATLDDIEKLKVHHREERYRRL